VVEIQFCSVRSFQITNSVLNSIYFNSLPFHRSIILLAYCMHAALSKLPCKRGAASRQIYFKLHDPRSQHTSRKLNVREMVGLLWFKKTKTIQDSSRPNTLHVVLIIYWNFHENKHESGVANVTAGFLNWNSIWKTLLTRRSINLLSLK
jgi:hypothetical protein